MTKFHITLKSKNAKTGNIPVSTTSGDTCPTTCGQYQNCYAKFGPLALHWRKLSDGDKGITLSEFVAIIAALPDGQLWRHNQAGDLPGVDQTIERNALESIVSANRGKRGFTYTHKPLTDENIEMIRYANNNGFTVNVSCDTIADADNAVSLGVGPVCVVVPKTQTSNFTTPSGNKVVICPATNRDTVSCETCKLCAWSERKAIIAFPAHGIKAKYITIESSGM